MSIKETFSEIGLFHGISAEALERIVGLSSVEHCPGDYTVFSEGDLLTHLYIVEQGAVQMSVDVRLWPEQETVKTSIRTIQGGDVFGWASVLNPPTAVTSAHTLSNSTLIAIDGTKLRELLIHESPLAYNMMAELFRVVGERDRVTGHAQAMEEAVTAAGTELL